MRNQFQTEFTFKKLFRIFPSTVLIAAFFIFASSCKKKDNCEAGLGGDLTVVAYLKHHGRIIANQVGHPDTVWVKFNTQNAPEIGRAHV